MSLVELYSARLKAQERAGQPDVYQYDELPRPLLVQVIHIWNDAIGPYSNNRDPQDAVWNDIHNTLAREKGVFYLSRNHEKNPALACQHYLLNVGFSDALDLIELSFAFISAEETQQSFRTWRDPYAQSRTSPDDAIHELNERFRAHGVGFQFVQGQIIRVDSQYLHAEAVKPALSLLQGAGFEGPTEEFLKAHDHYRHGRDKEAITEALKAFESTLKAICAERSWNLKGTETASQLLTVVFDNGLIPPYLSSQFTSLKSLLEAGLPTVRNKTSAHGGGPTPTTVPEYMVTFALNLAASNIVLLVKAHESMP